MADTGRQARTPKPTSATPEDYLATPPYPSPSHDFTLQAVMHMQEALGKLTEAVESLKEQSKEHGKELKEIGKDVHAAKAVARTLLWFVGAAGTLLGIILAAYFRQLFSGPVPH